MNELLQRLGEIRERASEIRKMDVIGEAEREELAALLTERKEIEQKVEDENALIALEAEDPKVEEKPEPKAEDPAEDPKPDDKPDDPAVEEPSNPPAEPKDIPTEPVKEPTPEAIAAAIGSVPQGDVPENESSTGLAIVASAASFGVQSGENLIAESWNRIHRIASGAQAGVKQTFGTIMRHSGENAVSPRNSAIQNSVLMSRPMSKQDVILPITAAACYCGPNEVDKSIDSRGLDERPVAASIRTVPFTGPFDYVRDMDLGDVSTGVTLWECAQQEAVVAATPGTWKPCVTLDCGDAVTVTPYMIPACGLFSIHQKLSHPELVDDFINKLGIYYARLAEQALLDKIVSDNTTLTYGPAGMGLLHQLEGAISGLASIAGYTRRLRWDDYTLYLPPGMMTAITADEHRRGFSRGAEREAILAQIRALGISNIVEMLDVDTAHEAGILTAAGIFIDPGDTVALNICNLPATWTVHLVATDAYVRGESTVVEAGFERDTNLIRQNMVQYFFEGHEFLEKRTPDVPGWTIELGGAATGGASALVTPEAC